MDNEQLEKCISLLKYDYADIRAKMMMLNPGALLEFKGAVVEALKNMSNDISHIEKQLEEHKKEFIKFKDNEYASLKKVVIEIYVKITLIGAISGLVGGSVLSWILK